MEQGLVDIAIELNTLNQLMCFMCVIVGTGFVSVAWSMWIRRKKSCTR